MTTGALFGLGHIENKFILGGELKILKAGEDDDTQRVLRQFISEREITHHRLEGAVTSTGRGYVMTAHSVSGVAAIAWTSTKDPQALNDEFAARLTSVRTDDSSDVTSEVMRLKAQRAQDPIGTQAAEDAIVEIFHNFDLSLESLHVTVPFADLIVIDNSDTTARSNFDMLLQHTMISALA